MKATRFLFIIAACVTSLLSSCSDDTVDDFPPLKLGNIKIRHEGENVRDIVVNSDKNTFEIDFYVENVSGEISEFSYVDDKDTSSPNTDFIYYDWNRLDRTMLDRHIVKPTGCDWISIEPTSVPGRFTVSVDENTTGERRGVNIIINSSLQGYDGVRGCLAIWQRDGIHEPEFNLNVSFDHYEYSYCDYETELTSTHCRQSSGWLDNQDCIRFDNLEMEYWMNRLLKCDDIEVIYTSSDHVHLCSENSRNIAVNIGLSFDTEYDVPENFGVDKKLVVSDTRADNPFSSWDKNASGYCALFDDTDFKDTSRHMNLYNFDDYVDINSLQSIGLNDKVSSLVVGYKGNNPNVCTVLTVWEDTDYNHGDKGRRKHRISFIASMRTPYLKIPNLKTVMCTGSSASWNDRISSMSLHFGYVDSSLINY